LQIAPIKEFAKLEASDCSKGQFNPVITILPFEKNLNIYDFSSREFLNSKSTAVFITFEGSDPILLKNGGDCVKSMLKYFDLNVFNDFGRLCEMIDFQLLYSHEKN
jgi:hypothetical protein